jgi:signal peptidase I
LENLTSLFRGFQAYLSPRVEFGEVRGTSMRPAFDYGDILFYVQFPIENLRLGDIIIWEGLHENIAHRVVELVGPGLVRTKGDNLLSPDRDLVSAGEMRGLVIGVLFTSRGSWHG